MALFPVRRVVNGVEVEPILVRKFQVVPGKGVNVWPANYAPDAPPDFYDLAWTPTQDPTLPTAVYRCAADGTLIRGWAGKQVDHLHRDAQGRITGSGTVTEVADTGQAVALDARGYDAAVPG